MIITYKDINNYKLKIGKPQKYTSDYSFIPISIRNNNINSLIQTPRLFIPYGIKTIGENREILDISLWNISNDNTVSLFYDLLVNILQIIISKFSDTYLINNFIKNSEYNYSMRLKIVNSNYYNHHKQSINTLKSNSYGRFIIDLNGLWLYKSELWFQWYLIQGEVNEPYIPKDYLFIDDIVNKSVQPPRPPPPPPPLPVFKKTKNKIIINKRERKDKEKDNSFSPPSLEELQITLSKLKKI